MDNFVIINLIQDTLKRNKFDFDTHAIINQVCEAARVKVAKTNQPDEDTTDGTQERTT